MKRVLIAALLTALSTGSALAEDLAADGQNVFKKYCRACHTVVDNDGNVLFRGGRVGPDLFNVFGRQAGTLPGYKYSKSMIAAGEGGLVWGPKVFDTYIEKPNEMISHTKMMFVGLRDQDDIKALTAYLESVSPDYKPAD